jgi:copper homeostasis protein
MTAQFQLEICAYSFASCIEAQCGGATRVELCAGMHEDGTTPSYGTIVAARKQLEILLHVIIRPRGGNFVYNEQELQIMCDDIRMAKHCKVDGIVFGCLTQEGDVDIVACRRLMTEAAPLSVTFHRAFDACRNPQKSLEDIIELGCQRLLTSGQCDKAQDGIPLIRQLVRQAENRIVIMPGSGITPDNIAEIARETNAREFHTSAQVIRGEGSNAAVVAQCLQQINKLRIFSHAIRTQSN